MSLCSNDCDSYCDSICVSLCFDMGCCEFMFLFACLVVVGFAFHYVYLFDVVGVCFC